MAKPPIAEFRERENDDAELKRIVDDLSVLVRRLAQSLRKAAPDNDFPEKAMDYLRRNKMGG